MKKDFQSIFEQWKKTKEEIKNLQEEEKVLKAQLMSIPAGSKRDGIAHKVTIGRSVQWKKVIDLTTGLVPKTKRDLVNGFIAENTTEYEKHEFKAE